MFRTSTNKIITDESLIQKAREYASKNLKEGARKIRSGEKKMASHVTKEEKLKIAKRKEDYANEIIAGRHDVNFTVWQRMNYYLTGECPGFLA